MEEVRMYMQMGQQQTAFELMEVIKTNRLAYEEKIKKRERSVPDGISIPSKTDSGHVVTEYGKQLYREEMMRDEEEDEEEDEDEDEEEDEEEDDNEVDETDDEEDTISKAQKDGTPV
jgi:predicted kinase